MLRLLVLLLLLAPGRVALAQRGTPLDSGTRVRVFVQGSPKPIVGTIAIADSATLGVQPAGTRTTLQLRTGQLRALEMSQGRPPAGHAFWRGAGTGFLIGAGVGLVATGAVYLSGADEDCNDCMITATVVTAAFAVASTALATTVGGVLGVVTRPERWTSVALPARVTLAPGGRGGAGLGVALRF